MESAPNFLWACNRVLNSPATVPELFWEQLLKWHLFTGSIWMRYRVSRRFLERVLKDKGHSEISLVVA